MRLCSLIRRIETLFRSSAWISIELNHHYLTEHRAPPTPYQIHISPQQKLNGESVASKHVLIKIGDRKFALRSKALPQLANDQYVAHTNIGGKYNVLTLGQPVKAQIRKAHFWEIIQFNRRIKTWAALISFGLAAIALHGWGELSGNYIAEILVFACVIFLTLVGLRQAG